MLLKNNSVTFFYEVVFRTHVRRQMEIDEGRAEFPFFGLE
jgi:hypothetical protein